MRIGDSIRMLETCSSTNDIANELALQGEPEGTVVLAEEQTKGRGTKGRDWFSPRGKGLYASVILRPLKRDMSLLPLAAGVAVREALLGVFGLFTRLRWPNDVLYGREKIGGILCEGSFLGNRVSHMILGIGVNLNQTRREFPREFRKDAVSVRMALGKTVSRDRLLPLLWDELDIWYREFLRGREARIVAAFEDRSVFSPGDTLEVSLGERAITGAYSGIDERGRLVLQSGGRTRALLAAEVSGVKILHKEG